MKYPYIVVRDGIWYPSGTEVPDDATPSNDKTIEKPVVSEVSEKTTRKRSGRTKKEV